MRQHQIQIRQFPLKLTRFARQFDSDSGILQLMRDLGSVTSQDAPTCMLGGGNPAMIPEIETAFRVEMNRIMASGREFETMLGAYDAPKGNQAFIEALAELLAEQYGWPLTARNIGITNGSQSSFAVLFNLFGGPSDDGQFHRVLFPVTPEYIGYGDIGWAEQSIFTAIQPQIELQGERFFKYRIDFDQLVLGDDIGALCLSRPTNPTGNVVTDEELNQLIQLASAKDIPLILDCAYGQPFPDIIFTDTQPLWNRDIILCMSLSKLGLPGVRTGIIIADEPVIKLVTGANAIFNLAPGRFGPTLATHLVRSGKILDLSRNVIRPWYRKRSHLAIEIASQLMEGLPCRIHISEGSIFLWLWFDGMPIDSETLYQRLKSRGVYILSGHHFFPGLVGKWHHKHECIRVSYAAPKDRLMHGLSVIAEEVRMAYEGKAHHFALPPTPKRTCPS